MKYEQLEKFRWCGMVSRIMYSSLTIPAGNAKIARTGKPVMNGL